MFLLEANTGDGTGALLLDGMPERLNFLLAEDYVPMPIKQLDGSDSGSLLKIDGGTAGIIKRKVGSSWEEIVN